MTDLRISFVLPGYFSFPIGGYRVIYEYADFLVSRGHEVTVVYPKGQSDASGAASLLQSAKNRLWPLKTRLSNRPLVPWHQLDPRVELALVPAVQDRYIPDGDIVVATGWSTARPVADLSANKGVKVYLIQGYETWAGPEEEVNATWRLPLYKIVISRWLQKLGAKLGATNLRHIPNGVDLRRFRVITRPEDRPLSVLSLYHDQKSKGIPDALAVLQRYHQRFPYVPVSMFGARPRGPDIPDWIQYFTNPDQDTLVRDIYNRHAIYLGASIAEGWALPPAEGMACGCAFVGTDSGGCRDYALDADTALLSAPGDRDALFNNLVRITEDASLRNRIQRSGTENIQQFTWDAAGRAMERYFLELAPDRSRVSA